MQAGQGQGLPAGVPALYLGLEEPPLSLRIPPTAPFRGILFRCPNGRSALHPPCSFTAASDVVLLGDPFPPGTGFLREGCTQQAAQRREAKGSLTAEAAPWAQRGPAVAPGVLSAVLGGAASGCGFLQFSLFKLLTLRVPLCTVLQGALPGPHVDYC